MTCPRCHDTRIIPFGEADRQVCPACQPQDSEREIVWILAGWVVFVAGVMLWWVFG